MHVILFQHVQNNHETFPLAQIGEKGNSCRFCKSIHSSFRNSSHSIPEFLGNKSIFTLDECDQCNSYFGSKLEKDLSWFVPPSWFTRLKGKKGYSKYDSRGGFILSSDRDFINITAPQQINDSYLRLESRGREYCNVKVYKAWIKMLISLIPCEYLHEFSGVTEWLLSNDGFEVINHSPYVVIGHQLPDIRLDDVITVEVIRQIVDEMPVYQFSARFNNFHIKVPFSPKARCFFKGKVQINSASASFEDIYFEEIDLSNYSSRHNYRLLLNLDSN